MAEVWIPERFGPRDPVALRSSQKTLIRPAGTVFHTAVSGLEKLRPTGTVRWTSYLGKSGKLYAFFSCNRPAACQRDGNYWKENGVGWGFNSMESWDGRGTLWDGVNVEDCPEWNDAQCETIVDYIAWHADEFNLPIRKPRHCRERGYGVHRDFTAREGLRWNTTHACPADRRARQFLELRAEAARNGASPAPIPKPPEDDMPTAQEIAKALLDAKLIDNPASPYHISVREALTGITGKLDAEKQRDTAEARDEAADEATLRQRIDAIDSKLNALSGLVNQALSKENPS